MKSCIYVIENLINDKIYIGSAKDFHFRKYSHKNLLKNNKHYNKYLQNAWNKYGEENLFFGILEYCEIEKLIEREQWWINFTNSYNHEIGYNLQPNAGSNLGFKYSEASKAKMSAWQIGRKMSAEAKKKMSNAAISNAMKGKKNALGFKHTKETREKMKLARKGKKHSEEHKAKVKSVHINIRNNFLKENMLNHIAGLMSLPA